MSAPFDAQTLVPATVLVASLFGSMHCAAMCGPLVLAVAPTKKSAAAYHLGRLAGYAGMGALFGFLGQQLLSSTAFRYLPLLSAVLIAGLFLALGIRQLATSSMHLRLPAALARLHARALGAAARRGRQASGAAAVGLLSVLLPCGWLYSFLLSATATQNALWGAGLLVAFWAGTLPALFVGPVVFNRVVRPFRAAAPRFSGVLLILVGVATLGWRAYPALTPRAPAKAATEAAMPADCPMHHQH